MIEKNPCPKTKKKKNKIYIYKRHILQHYTSAVYVGCNKLAYSWCFKYKIYLYNFSEQQFWFFDYIIIVEHSSVHIYETFLYKSKHVTNFCLIYVWWLFYSANFKQKTILCYNMSNSFFVKIFSTHSYLFIDLGNTWSVHL